MVRGERRGKGRRGGRKRRDWNCFQRGGGGGGGIGRGSLDGTSTEIRLRGREEGK